ncbi:MAG TPA: DMT family transporter [Methanomassiliicoccales archaeon]|jgi:drug/metabolite transporter (DMT)-like permease
MRKRIVTSDESAALLITIISSAMLGSSYVAAKMGVSSVDPFLFGAIAMGVGTLVILAFMAWRRSLKLSMFKRWEFWTAPVLNTVVVASQYIGLTMTTAAVAGLIVGSNVIFVAIFSRLAFGERLGRNRTIGLIIGFLGLVTLTTKWELTTLNGDQLLGDLLILVSAVFIALVVIMSRVALRHMEYDQWSLSLHMFLPLTLLIMALTVGNVDHYSGDALPLTLYVGIMCSTVPTMLWVKALKHISVVTSATVLMLESTFAVVLSWLVLGEQIDQFVLCGALLTFLAIVLVAKQD